MSVPAKWLVGKAPLMMPLYGEEITSTKPRWKSVFVCIFCFRLVCLCCYVFPGPIQYILCTPMAWYSLPVLKVQLYMNIPNQTFSSRWRLLYTFTCSVCCFFAEVFIWFWSPLVLLEPFSALTLLVGWQKRYLACIKTVLACWWQFDWSFAHLKSSNYHLPSSHAVYNSILAWRPGTNCQVVLETGH